MVEKSTCSVGAAIQLIGGKYKAVILWHLMGHTLRYSELHKLIAAATDKMLAQQLRELERDGLVYSQRTSGRYVTEDQTAIMEARHALAADRVRSFLTDMERLGFEKEDLLSLLRQESEKE